VSTQLLLGEAEVGGSENVKNEKTISCE
jgi:hypothetical protein